MIVYCSIEHAGGKEKICERLLQFCYGWTGQIEIETAYAWYCRLPDHFIPAEFGTQFLSQLKARQLSGRWGAGATKLIAKLAALTRPSTSVSESDSQAFLGELPVTLLDALFELPEVSQLQRLGINTFKALSLVPFKALQLQFGDAAENIAKLARGQDLQPFTPEKPIVICWEIDFLTDPEIAMPVARPQLDLFLKKGLSEIEHQLRSAQLLAAKIRLEWQHEHTDFGLIRKFDPPTAAKDVFYRSVLTILPEYPIELLRITGLDFSPQLPKQLDIFGQNPTRRKIESLKSQLSAGLVQLKLSRREKILAMWEQSHL
ncbi:MAG TPA: hypothetical protein GX739_00155 [Firmicutes bacterium]|nr:hypothetical protein [Bacillota bacterium]